MVKSTASLIATLNRGFWKRTFWEKDAFGKECVRKIWIKREKLGNESPTGNKSPLGNKNPGKKSPPGGAIVLLGKKVRKTKVWGTKVSGTKVHFLWAEIISTGTKFLRSKLRGMKVLQP